MDEYLHSARRDTCTRILSIASAQIHQALSCAGSAAPRRFDRELYTFFLLVSQYFFWRRRCRAADGDTCLNIVRAAYLCLGIVTLYYGQGLLRCFSFESEGSSLPAPASCR
jgi:hypothetical protein